MTPHEQIERLAAELDRLHSQDPNAHGILRLTDAYFKACSKWKWEQHGWTVSDQQICGIMNGNDRERRAALLSVLQQHMIDAVEFVAGVDVLEIVPNLSVSAARKSEDVCRRDNPQPALKTQRSVTVRP
jgi:hypothetical protein